MNKKIVLIFVLTLIAIAVLYLYSFGPLSGRRIAHKLNPASLKPAQTQQFTVNNKPQIFNIYHNKDLKENYYTVKLPQDWQVQSGNAAGSFALRYPGGYGAAELMDVPDNTTLELYILSQEEPRLKKTLAGYRRVDYAKITANVNNAESFQLVYAGTISGKAYQTVRTYIAGPDHAGVITLSARQKDYSRLKALFASIIGSFQWENR